MATTITPEYKVVIVDGLSSYFFVVKYIRVVFGKE